MQPQPPGCNILWAMRRHLAIFSKDTIRQIFSGKKTIESRFSKKKISPFGQVAVGDTVYIKPSGEEIVGQFFVSKVFSIEGLDDSDWKWIKTDLLGGLGFTNKQEQDSYFNARSASRYCTLIYIDRVEQFITSPIKIPKKDLRGWVALD